MFLLFKKIKYLKAAPQEPPEMEWPLKPPTRVLCHSIFCGMFNDTHFMSQSDETSCEVFFYCIKLPCSRERVQQLDFRSFISNTQDVL